MRKLLTVKYATYLSISWLGLLTERLWNRLWPAFTVAAFFAAAALFNLLSMFGAVWHTVIDAAFALAFAATLIFSRYRFVFPSRNETERHMERVSTLPHRPLETIKDKPAENLTADTEALWQKHLQQASLYIRQLRIYIPRPDVAAHDRWALRHIAVILLAVGLVIAQGDALPRLRIALSPDVGSLVDKKSIALDLWIAPPQYTGLAPVFLSTARQGVVTHGDVAVPEGSLLKLRLSGYRYAPRIQYAGEAHKLSEPTPSSYTIELPIGKSGELSLNSLLHRLGKWYIEATPDTAPQISIGKVEATPRSATKIFFTANDDYGVSKLTGTISPAPGRADQQAKKSASFDMGAAHNGDSTHVEDLTAHPWAGQPVTLTLEAEDKVGHKTTSFSTTFTLPERVFTNPVAKKLIALRKVLLMGATDENTLRGVAKEIADIADQPVLYKDNHVTFLALTVALRRLIYDGSEEAVEATEDILWNVALKLEDGGMTATQMELRESLQKMADAAADKNTTKEEMREILEDVQKKMQDYVQAMAKEMQQRMKDGKQTPMMSPELAEKFMKNIDLGKMLEQMRQMSEGNSRETLQKMAENLKNAIENIDIQKLDQMQEQQIKAMESLQELEDAIHRQQSLYDRTNKSDDPADTQENATEQSAVRRILGQALQKMGDAGADIPENFGRADQAMKSAGEALKSGRARDSLPHQATALQEMQKGLDDAAKQMAEMMQQSIMSFGLMPNSGNYGEGYDPLGRQSRNLDDGSTKIPNEKEQRRVQEIIQELRSRSNEPNRTKVERDYIERLLDQF